MTSIDKLEAVRLVRVEPFLDRLYAVPTLLERDCRLVRCFRALRWNGRNRVEQVLLICGKYLDHVTIQVNVGELDKVCARRKDPSRHFHGLAESDHGFLV